MVTGNTGALDWGRMIASTNRGASDYWQLNAITDGLAESNFDRAHPHEIAERHALREIARSVPGMDSRFTTAGRASRAPMRQRFEGSEFYGATIQDSDGGAAILTSDDEPAPSPDAGEPEGPPAPGGGEPVPTWWQRLLGGLAPFTFVNPCWPFLFFDPPPPPPPPPPEPAPRCCPETLQITAGRDSSSKSEQDETCSMKWKVTVRAKWAEGGEQSRKVGGQAAPRSSSWSDVGAR